MTRKRRRRIWEDEETFLVSIRYPARSKLRFAVFSSVCVRSHELIVVAYCGRLVQSGRPLCTDEIDRQLWEFDENLTRAQVRGPICAERILDMLAFSTRPTFNG